MGGTSRTKDNAKNAGRYLLLEEGAVVRAWSLLRLTWEQSASGPRKREKTFNWTTKLLHESADYPRIGL
jgi:hypothetical protein